MKSGTGDDPFADESDDSEGRSTERTESGASETPESTEPDVNRPEDRTDDHIPWVLRRRRVKEDRDDVRQFFLREDAADGERQLRNEVEDRLGKGVKKLDLREAAYLVAQRHPDEVAAELRKWGYDYL